MTLAAIKKLAIRLPLADRMKLADALWRSVPPPRKRATLGELERRADEIESGRVKALPESALDALLEAQEKRLHQRRARQRG